ncbi:MAG: tRNA (adenosine(37)-N6)-dimethylallyltransferase MiaA [Hasllibacter sp.]
MLLPQDYPAAEVPVLIAGPTASGKSALALALAEAQGRTIVNADALQAWADWRVLTARPTAADEARAPHALYGHLAWEDEWSVGHWLRQVEPLLAMRPAPVIAGGTGLAFRALLEGLADIPAIPPEIRAEARRADPSRLLEQLDRATREGIDTENPARVRRAWEVLTATGTPLSTWQARTPPPLLRRGEAAAYRIETAPGDLTPRIEARFDRMLKDGALDEARGNLGRDPARPAARAIGAPELSAFLRGEISLEAARDRAVIATRRYAKRQRTWLRARMTDWTPLSLS